MLKGVTATGKILVRLVPALALFACGGDDPKVPTKLLPVSAAPISGTVGSVLGTIPSVTLQDQKGRAMANVWVRWVANAGKVVNDSSKTDANGTASAGNWTLGTVAGPQTLNATVIGLPITVITADAKPGPAASLTVITTASSAVVASDVTTLPSVRATDVYNNPVPGAAVTFTVTSGAGSITGAQQTTNASGVATVGSWKLGTLAGAQTLRADVAATGASTTMTATALSAPASQIVLVTGNGQTGYANKRLCTSPTISVRDQYGNGVGGIPVVFVPANGSGTVTGGTVNTSATTGNATVTAWNLGASGVQTLVATAAGLTGKSVTFEAAIGPEAGYSICARFIGDGGTPRQREAVTKAVVRWQKVIVGHVGTRNFSAPAGECHSSIPAINESVEDLLLFVEIAAIDGPRNILGQAGPCYVYTPANLTLMGFLQLDAADLELMLTDGTLDNVVTHEIGHILGIGTLWNYRRTLLTGAGTADPFFLGAEARSQFGLLPNNYAGTPVPVENTGGAGTRDAHWRKSVFNTELMQGFSNPSMPMSRVTVGSLADLGYTVDLNGADNFSFLSALRSTPLVEREMISDVMDIPLWGVERNGAKQLLRSPVNPLLRR